MATSRDFALAGDVRSDSLTVAGGTLPSVSPSGDARLVVDSADDKAKISVDGGSYVDLLASPSVVGGGAFAGAGLTRHGSLFWNPQEDTADRAVRFPFAGTLDLLYVWAAAAPSAGDSYTITIRKNESNTSLAVAIGGTDTTGEDTSDSVTVVAGDEISWSLASTAGVPNNTKISIAMRFMPA